MFEAITGVLTLIAVIGAITIMVIAGIDTALRESYKQHALRLAREKYRKWCAQTPVEIETQLTFVCGKGYNPIRGDGVTWAQKEMLKESRKKAEEEIA